MIANPIEAIGNCTNRTELAKVLHEIMKPWYPNYDVNSWELWSMKYSRVNTAKKCALSFYRRKLGK